MSSGGGDEDDDNPFKKFADRALDLALNASTSGMAGYKDGKIRKGNMIRWSDEGIGELTGRNQQRKALHEQEKIIAEEKRAKKREADLLWLDNYRRDVSASSAAQGMRNTSEARARGAGSQKLGSSSEELLGV